MSLDSSIHFHTHTPANRSINQSSYYICYHGHYLLHLAWIQYLKKVTVVRWFDFLKGAYTEYLGGSNIIFRELNNFFIAQMVSLNRTEYIHCRLMCTLSVWGNGFSLYPVRKWEEFLFSRLAMVTSLYTEMPFRGLVNAFTTEGIDYK